MTSAWISSLFCPSRLAAGFGGDGILVDFLSYLTAGVVLYWALKPRQIGYLTMARGPIPPGARPLPGWMRRLAMLALALSFLSKPLSDAQLVRGPEEAFWFFGFCFLGLLGLGSLWLSLTPGPTFLGEPCPPTKQAYRTYRRGALFISILLASVSIWGLWRYWPF